MCPSPSSLALLLSVLRPPSSSSSYSSSRAALGALALAMAHRLRDFEVHGKPLKARMGIHCGPVIGGVIGVKLPRYR